MLKSAKTSSYYGVSKVYKGIFRVMSHNNKIRTIIGYFENEIDAALAYDNHVKKNNLDRRLNFPEPEPENLIPNTRLIRLTKGKFAIVDEEDYEKVNQYHWGVTNSSGCETLYACRTVMCNGKKKKILMHRFIMNAKSLDIDHRNGNGLHNYKSNLRECTENQNMWNSRPNKKSSSNYKGVTFHKRDKKYYCNIAFKNKHYHLGVFKDEIEAAKYYDAKAKELYGEFARLNFPDNA